MAAERAGERSQPRRGRRGWWIALAIIVTLVVLARFAVSPIATYVVNRKLAAMDGFVGRVETVEIALWTGSIVVQDFVLRDRQHPDDLPLVKVPKATFTGALRPLLQGKIGGRGVVERAEFNVVKRRVFEGPKEALDEAKQEVDEREAEARRWQDALREALPMEVSRFELKDSQARFVDRAHDPVVDVGLQKLHLVATEIRNREDPSDAPMKVELNGVTTGNGRLTIRVEADPMAEPLEFFSSFELKELSLPPFNSFLRAYTGTDVSRGTFDVYMEATASGGGYEGYIKPFFSDLEFENVRDDEKPFLSQVKEAAVGAVSAILENEETEKVATQTPFSGRFGKNDVGLWETIENLWRNAFIQALREGLGVPAKDEGTKSE